MLFEKALKHGLFSRQRGFPPDCGAPCAGTGDVASGHRTGLFLIYLVLPGGDSFQIRRQGIRKILAVYLLRLFAMQFG
jgi:hypothetical protein